MIAAMKNCMTAPALMAGFLLIVTKLTVPAPGVLAADTPAQRVIIAEILWEIDGRTRQWALENASELEVGQEFASSVELAAYLDAQRQILFNQRQLQTVDVSYGYLDDHSDPPGAQDVQDPRPVVVTVAVRDTWNLVALPYFKYDSNDGLLLSIRMRDYNFFGSLEALRINLDYERTDDNKDIISLDTNVNYPFRMADRQWEAIFTQGLEIEYDSVDFTVGIGLGHQFEWFGLDWRTELLERVRIMNQDEEGDNWYLITRWSLESDIRTPWKLAPYGRFRYRPTTGVQFNARPDGVSTDRRGIEPFFDHRLQAGGFDWIENYRRGHILTLENRNMVNTYSGEITSSIHARSSHYLHSDAIRRAGLSASISGFYIFTGTPEDQDNAAEDIRGVLNDTMRGNLGFFLNLDATVTALTIPRLLEGQVNLFFDTGYVTELDSDSATPFMPYESGRRDLKFGTGVELIGFPLFARSLYLRVSYGIDLLRVVSDGDSPLDSRARVIFIGLRHHY